MPERVPLRTRPATRERHAGGAYFRPPEDEIDFFSSGSKLLDLVLGGGWARGRVINIIGNSSAGKTLLATEAATNFALKYPQGKIRYRETERAFLMSYAKQIGMPIDRVDFGVKEHRLRTVEDLGEELQYRAANANGPELFIVDSLDALSSREELKRAIGSATYAMERAKLMSEMFRTLIDPITEAGITLIIISQIRDKVGARFGPKHTRSGGKGLDFYSSQIVQLAQIAKIYKTVNKIKRPVGNLVIARTDKNKVGLPFREVRFPILYSWGIDDISSCIDWLKSTGGVGDALGNPQLREEVFRKMCREGEGDWKRAIERMHMVVDERWHKIEASFMPPRSKYS